MAPHERDRSPVDEHDQQQRQIANSNTPLLSKLPAEIRNEVWRMVLPATLSPNASMRCERKSMVGLELGYLSVDFTNDPAQGWLDTTGPLKLMRACRQVRTEAIGIFYGETTFTLGIGLKHDENLPSVVDDFELTISWLRSLSTDAVKFLRHVVLMEYDDCFGYWRSVDIDLEKGIASCIFTVHDWEPKSLEEMMQEEGCRCAVFRRDEIVHVLESVPLSNVSADGGAANAKQVLASVFSSFATWGDVLREWYLPIGKGLSPVEFDDEYPSGWDMRHEAKLKEVTGWIRELD